jgi:hypothetical protein
MGEVRGRLFGEGQEGELHVIRVFQGFSARPSGKGGTKVKAFYS